MPIYRHILIPLGGSACSDGAAEISLSLTEKLQAAMTFTCVAFVVADSDALTDGAQTEVRLGETLLDCWCRAGAGADLSFPGGTRLCGESIPDPARGDGCDLIVMGTHGRSGMKKLPLGRADGGRQYSVRPAERWTRVLVPVDSGPTSAHTLRIATTLARAPGAAVDIVTVVSDLALITPVSLGPFASGIDDDHVTRD